MTAPGTFERPPPEAVFGAEDHGQVRLCVRMAGRGGAAEANDPGPSRRADLTNFPRRRKFAAAAVAAACP